MSKRENVLLGGSSRVEKEFREFLRRRACALAQKAGRYFLVHRRRSCSLIYNNTTVFRPLLPPLRQFLRSTTIFFFSCPSPTTHPTLPSENYPTTCEDSLN